MTESFQKVVYRGIGFVIAALLGGGCDLSSKHWAEETLRDVPNRTLSVIDPWLDLRLEYNPGTAFSVIQDLGTNRMLLGVFALVMVIAMLGFALRGRLVDAIAFGVIAGGAIGNGLDRVWREGVVDFIVVNYPGGGSWPTFNVADALVAIGVGILILSSFRRPPARTNEPASEQPGG